MIDRMNGDGSIDLDDIDPGDEVRLTYVQSPGDYRTIEREVFEVEYTEGDSSKGVNGIRVSNQGIFEMKQEWIFWDGGYASEYVDQHSRPVIRFEVLR